MAQNKPVAVSGIRPTGNMHIGNYLGAIKQFVEFQKQYKTYFFIADLHAITEPQDPKKMQEQILHIACIYLACGLDPKKTILFAQSQVPEHVMLAHVLGTIAPMGDLSRMTQYKEKIADGKPANFGLFAYPVLMSADILAYNPDAVPVGDDQLQHLEFARELARKFNTHFGKTFKEPKAIIQKETARIMGLDDPTKKMSKSAGVNNYIALLDEPAEIRRKIKSAVTDSGNEIKFNLTEKPGISNLLTIYSSFSGESIPQIEEKYAGKNYGAFKSDLAEVVVSALSPIQDKYNKFAKNKSSVLKVLKEGSKKAGKVAMATMKDVRKKIGLFET